jgi:hypothetical protein
MHKQRAFHYSFIQQLMNCCNLIGWDVGSETSSVRRIAHCTQGTCERVRKGLAELLLFGLYRIDHFSISLKFSIKLVEKIVDYDITHSVHSGMWGRCADDRGRSGGLALVDFRCWLRCERCARTDLNNKLKLCTRSHFSSSPGATCYLLSLTSRHGGGGGGQPCF